MADIHQVKLSKHAERDLKKLPAHIVYKLQMWIDGVKRSGWAEMRKVPGYNDEALRGQRQGQRSIRLNKAYRAIYIVDESGEIHFIEVIEVNKHEY